MAFAAHSFKYDWMFEDESYDDIGAILYMACYIFFIIGVISGY